MDSLDVVLTKTFDGKPLAVVRNLPGADARPIWEAAGFATPDALLAAYNALLVRWAHRDDQPPKPENPDA